MGRADYLKRGSYNAICDICGGKFKADELRRTWGQGRELTNYMACRDCSITKSPRSSVVF